MVNVEKSDKKEVAVKIRIDNSDILLFAFDKKRLDESDLIKAYKKAQSLSLPYHIYSKGEIPKKIKESMEAYKKLDNIGILQ